MRDFPPVPEVNAQAIVDWIRAIARLRSADVSEIRNLDNKLVRGRLRTDRTAPVSHSDVAAGVDKEGDIVRTATYEYILINDAGALKWARHALDVVW